MALNFSNPTKEDVEKFRRSGDHLIAAAQLMERQSIFSSSTRLIAVDESSTVTRPGTVDDARRHADHIIAAARQDPQP